MPHYALLLGGVSSAEAFGTRLLEVPALNVAAAVREVIRYYQSERLAAESFSAFVGRVGPPSLRRRLEPFTPVHSPAEEPAFYRDLGLDQPFAVGARGGECAA